MKPATKRNIIIGLVLTIGASGYSFVHGLQQRDQKLATLEADMKRKLPMKVDAITTLVNVKYETTTTTYWYILDTPYDRKTVQKAMESTVPKSVCTNPETSRTIRDEGFSYVYHYANKSGVPLADLTVSSCP